MTANLDLSMRPDEPEAPQLRQRQCCFSSQQKETWCDQQPHRHVPNNGVTCCTHTLLPCLHTDRAQSSHTNTSKHRFSFQDTHTPSLTHHHTSSHYHTIAHYHSITLSHTITHTTTHYHTHTHTLSHCHTVTLPHCHKNTHYHTHTFAYYHTHYHTHIHYHKHTIAHYHTHAITLSQTHTVTQSYYRTITHMRCVRSYRTCTAQPLTKRPPRW